MKKTIAVLGVALIAIYTVPSYSAEARHDKKAAYELNRSQDKTKQAKDAKEKVKKDAAALAKKKKEQEKAAKKAAKAEKKKVAKKNTKNPSKPHPVPEIDGSYGALAISLLACAVAIHRERRRIA